MSSEIHSTAEGGKAIEISSEINCVTRALAELSSEVDANDKNEIKKKYESLTEKETYRDDDNMALVEIGDLVDYNKEDKSIKVIHRDKKEVYLDKEDEVEKQETQELDITEDLQENFVVNNEEETEPVVLENKIINDSSLEEENILDDEQIQEPVNENLEEYSFSPENNPDENLKGFLGETKEFLQKKVNDHENMSSEEIAKEDPEFRKALVMYLYGGEKRQITIDDAFNGNTEKVLDSALDWLDEIGCNEQEKTEYLKEMFTFFIMGDQFLNVREIDAAARKENIGIEFSRISSGWKDKTGELREAYEQYIRLIFPDGDPSKGVKPEFINYDQAYLLQGLVEEKGVPLEIFQFHSVIGHPNSKDHSTHIQFSENPGFEIEAFESIMNSTLKSVNAKVSYPNVTKIRTTGGGGMNKRMGEMGNFEKGKDELKGLNLKPMYWTDDLDGRTGDYLLDDLSDTWKDHTEDAHISLPLIHTDKLGKMLDKEFFSELATSLIPKEEKETKELIEVSEVKKTPIEILGALKAGTLPAFDENGNLLIHRVEVKKGDASLGYRRLEDWAENGDYKKEHIGLHSTGYDEKSLGKASDRGRDHSAFLTLLKSADAAYMSSEVTGAIIQFDDDTRGYGAVGKIFERNIGDKRFNEETIAVEAVGRVVEWDKNNNPTKTSKFTDNQMASLAVFLPHLKKKHSIDIENVFASDDGVRKLNNPNEFVYGAHIDGVAPEQAAQLGMLPQRERIKRLHNKNLLTGKTSTQKNLG